MAFPWETAIAAGASSGLSILALAGAAWRFFLRDIRQGLIDLRKDVVELRKAERQEHKDVWTEHRNLYELRIKATHEALGRERDESRHNELATRHRRSEDEYLDLLDRAVKFPDIIDPSLRSDPQYVDFLKGRLEEATRGGPIDKAKQVSAEERVDLQQVLDRLERLAPAAATATDYVRRGNGYYSAGDYQQAFASYDQALRLQPEEPIALMNRGLALYSLGRREEALASLRGALEFRPDDPLILVNLGLMLRSLRDHEGEFTVFNRALELQPDDPDILVERGVALHQLGRRQDALADYNRALELRPTHPGALYNRACLLSLRGEADQALEDLQRAITGDSRCREMARAESDFDNIRSDPRFEALWPAVSIGSAVVEPGASVGVELTADTVVRIGAYTIDVVYDNSLLSATSCSANFGGVCNAAFAPNTVRFTGASRQGLTGKVDIGTITFEAGQSEGVASLNVLVRVLADANPGAPRDITPSLTIENGTLTIRRPQG